MHRWTKLLLAGGLVIAGLLPTVAEAQMGSRPFAFRNSEGSVGISTAGRQAIIDRKLFGLTPDVLLRDLDGSLLSVQRGPGHSAIVTDSAGAILPGYRGRGFNDGSASGVFNAYFLGSSDGSYPQYLETSATRVAIDSWTSSVIYGQPTSLGNGSIDQWTTMVYLMNGN